MSSDRRNTEKQAVYTRQATILRKNLLKWDHILRTPQGEDWPAMLGRLDAALNQTGNMDRSIEDVLEHFVYVPRKSTANAQDIPFFLSTRLETPTDDAAAAAKEATAENAEPKRSFVLPKDPVQHLAEYENQAAQLAIEFEDSTIRF
jgi:hypothetical protein